MLYVAYGSNMNIDQMEYRCPHSKIVGNGKLKGYQLVFNVHADIIESANSTTPVVVWDIDKKDWDMLDMYEGYPVYYIRKNVTVTFDDGREDEAIVYVMTDESKGIYPPGKSYFQGIIDGCNSNNINTDYLFDALQYSYNNKTNYNQYTR